jgi:glyoxylase-like metal-dependent hydrolase (beta-lactamase superfamily II)
VKWLKRIAVVLVVLLVVFKFVLLVGPSVPEKARFSIDLAALREKAGSQEAGPVALRAQHVTTVQFPAAVVFAGDGWDEVKLGGYSWELRYEDGSTLVIDPVQARSPEAPPGSFYDDAAWAKQEEVVAHAGAIVVTHEHFDHLGGVADSKHYDEIKSKLRLTAEQRKKLGIAGVKRDMSGEATLESGPEGSLHVVLPGVVTISAPGHTPGSQMIYARLKSGAEYLFVGDIAWNEGNLKRAVTRPRLITLIGEDQEAVANQLRAIIEFQKANPQVDVVVSHDMPAMERRFASGAVGKGF